MTYIAKSVFVFFSPKEEYIPRGEVKIIVNMPREVVVRRVYRWTAKNLKRWPVGLDSVDRVRSTACTKQTYNTIGERGAARIIRATSRLICSHVLPVGQVKATGPRWNVHVLTVTVELHRNSKPTAPLRSSL